MTTWSCKSRLDHTPLHSRVFVPDVPPWTETTEGRQGVNPDPTPTPLTLGPPYPDALQVDTHSLEQVLLGVLLAARQPRGLVLAQVGGGRRAPPTLHPKPRTLDPIREQRAE